MNSSISKSDNFLLTFPKVEKFTLTGDYPEEIDFTSFKNLKKFCGNSKILLNLNSPSLEIVECLIVEKNEDVSLSSTEKKIIEKYISFKNLKEIDLKLEEIDLKTISQIQGENNSLKKMSLQIRNGNENTNDEVNSLIKKFPNLEDVYVNPSINSGSDNETLKIKEDPNSKIDKFCINMYSFSNFEFHCITFEKLIQFKIECYNHVIKEQTFPLFSNNCKIIFKSLKTFKLSSMSESGNASTILFNLFQNMKCMPFLNEFTLIYRYQPTEIFYNKFIRKLLSLNLHSIFFSISRDSGKIFRYDFCSNAQLKEIYPKFHPYKYKKLYIYRY